MPSKQP